MKELITVNLFSGKILEYFPAPWVPDVENLKRLARIVVCILIGKIYIREITWPDDFKS